MDREEFEKIKAEEKAHLQELKKLKTQFKEAQRTQNLRRAMAEINSTIDPDKVLETELDAELKKDLPTEKDLATDLINQFKIEMGIIEDLGSESENLEVEKTIGKMPATNDVHEDPEEEIKDVPEKTLGKIRRKVDLKSEDSSSKESKGDN